VRKTSPACRQAWPDGKDPAEGWHNTLYSLRIGDMVKGLAGGQAVEAVCWFNDPVSNEITAGQVACRALELQDAEELLVAALDVIALAKQRFAMTPAVQSLPGYLEENGEPAEGLDGKKLDVAGCRVSWVDGMLRFSDAEERAREDGKWLLNLL